MGKQCLEFQLFSFFALELLERMLFARCISVIVDLNILNLICSTVKILKFGTPQTIAIIVLKIEKLDVTLH